MTGSIAANMVDNAFRVGMRSFVDTKAVGTAIPMSPTKQRVSIFESCVFFVKMYLLAWPDSSVDLVSKRILPLRYRIYLSRLAPSTMIGPATPRVALFSQPTLGQY